MKLLNLTVISRAVANVAARFPLAFLTALVGTGAMLWLVDAGSEPEKDFLRIVLACSLGLPLFVALTVFSEQKQLAAAQKWALQFMGLVAVGLIWWRFDLREDFQEMRQLVLYVGLSFLFHLAVSVAAYLRKNASVDDFWEFNKQLFMVFIAGALYSFVIFIGVQIALFASSELFHLNLRSHTYVRWFILVAGLFQTTFVLANFPKDFDFDPAEIRFELVVKNFVKFVLIPIVGLYFLILYAYSGKILLEWHLPRGWVSWLVMGFSVAGIFTWLLNFLLPKVDSSSLLAGFKKWFWWIVLPMLVLLFVAIGQRIHAYGLTEDRYLIAHLGGWLLVISLYFIISKKDDIRLIPLSLMAFSAIYLLPGIGGIDAGIRNQTSILASLLEKNGLLKDGKAVAPASPYTGEDANRIENLLGYLAERNAIQPVAAWLGQPADSLRRDKSRWEVSNSLAEKLGVGSQTVNAEAQTSYSYYSNSVLENLPIGGFETLSRVSLSEYNKESWTTLKLHNDSSTLLIFEEGVQVQTVDFQPLMAEIWRVRLDGDVNERARRQLDFTTESRRYRLVFENAQLEKVADKFRLVSFDGWLLSGKK